MFSLINAEMPGPERVSFHFFNYASLLHIQAFSLLPLKKRDIKRNRENIAEDFDHRSVTLMQKVN